MSSQSSTPSQLKSTLETSNQPSFSYKVFQLAVVIIIPIFLVITGVLAYQNMQAQRVIQDLRSKIRELEKIAEIPVEPTHNNQRSAINVQPSTTGTKPITLVLSPTHYPTVGWTTYKSEEYGFEILYPPSFTISQNDGSIYIGSEEKSGAEGPPGTMVSTKLLQIKIDKLRQNESINTVVQTIAIPSQVAVTFEGATVQSIEKRSSEYIPEYYTTRRLDLIGGMQEYAIFPYRPDTTNYLSIVGTGWGENSYAMFYGILSTFRFNR